MNVQLKNSTPEKPFEFWVKLTKTGKPRAYFYSRYTGKTPIPLAHVELAEAQGTAIRVSEPEF